MPATKQQIRQIIADNNLNSVADVYSLLKDSFKDTLQELMEAELSAEMISKITDRILPEIKEWQSRPLNAVCPFVFMDCIHYKVAEPTYRISAANA